nr:cyclin [Cryptococcus depauperatus CBS 7855]
MPVAPTTKPARPSSVYDRCTRASASPKSSRKTATQLKGKPIAACQRIVSRTKRAEVQYLEEDYTEEIVAYMRAMDTVTLASADLMDLQPELQWFMRGYLIDFIIEVHQQFRLRPEVLFLAMNIVDRYISKRVVYKKHYQLVGCTALWIAAKFEDAKDKVPLVHELSEMCCKAYDESAFIQMEGHVLSTIGWTLGHPSGEAWLRVFTSGSRQEDTKVCNMARFLMEVTLFYRDFIGIQSSIIAGGALMLARFICGKSYKPCYTGVAEDLAAKIAKAIDRRLSQELESTSEIVIRKYAPTYYDRVSTVCREWYLSGRRYSYNPVAANTGLSTPGLARSWNKRSSWPSGSPSGSCTSSEAGDDTPVTPITPVHTHVTDPFSVAKENVAPEQSSISKVARVCNVATVESAHGASKPQTVYSQRPALHTLPAVADIGISNRATRRLSN